MGILKKIHGIGSDFEEVFFFNEYQALAGRGLRTILALVTIMFFTFLALGFAVGGMENLKKKMDNPFTNWVNIDVTSAINQQSKRIQEQYNRQSVKDSFNLKNMNGFNRYVLDFYEMDFDPFSHQPDSLHRNSWGRTIEPDEPLLENVFLPKNVLWKSAGDIESCDIIVTKSLLKAIKFELPKKTDSVFFLPIRYEIVNKQTYDNESLLMYVRVFAVVEEIPGLGNRFISFPKLHNVIHARVMDGKTCQSIERNKKGATNYFLITNASDNLSKIESSIQEKFNLSPFVDIENTYLIPQKGISYGVRISFNSSIAPSLDEFRSFLKDFGKTLPVCEYAFFDCGGEQCEYLDAEDFYYLAFHFNELEHIRKFKSDILENFDIEMDMSQVESKENFWLVTRLTLLISLILLSFGILSIVIYVNSILRNHLYNIRPNLGTFQAFGLRNKFLTKTYLKIILSFLVLSIIISYFFTVLVDRIELFLNPENSMFNIFSPWIAVAIFLLVVISLGLAIKTIKKILSDTPGNLIYER